MAQHPQVTQRPVQRKRNRKRKRRDVSSSSSSSDSDSSSDVDSVTKSKAVTASVPLATATGSDSGSGSSSSDATSSSSDSDEEEESREAQQDRDGQNATDENRPDSESKSKAKARVPSPPPLHNVPVPSLTAGNIEKEQELKARFRQFWMGSIAEAFADDLNEIRKVSAHTRCRFVTQDSRTQKLSQEPNMTQSRLGLLIDSLAAGADVYSSRGPGGEGTSEMAIVLGE